MADIDKDKVKMMFSMLGELVAMFLSIITIFKKNEKNEPEKIVD